MNPDLIFAPLDGWSPEQGLTSSATRCLDFLRRQSEPRSPARIAHDVGMAAVFVGFALRELKSKGLARRLDGRRVYVATNPTPSDVA